MNALDTVNAMIRALEHRDVETALAYMADDIEYDNVPIGKVHGHDAVRTTLAPFLAGCSEVDWVIHHEAVTGDVVMNERTDRFHFPHRWVELAVAGLFVVRDGKIALWRDYFDLAQFQNQLG